LPSFRNHRLYRWGCEIIQAAPNDLLPGKAQDLPRADAGLSVLAVVIREQDGYGGMEDNRPEEVLQLFRAIFLKPARNSWLCGSGGQSRSFLRRPENSTSGKRKGLEWRAALF